MSCIIVKLMKSKFELHSNKYKSLEQASEKQEVTFQTD